MLIIIDIGNIVKALGLLRNIPKFISIDKLFGYNITTKNLIIFNIWLCSKAVILEVVAVFSTILTTQAFFHLSYITDANFWQRIFGKIGIKFTKMINI